MSTARVALTSWFLALLTAVLVVGCGSAEKAGLAEQAERESGREAAGTFVGVATPPGLAAERFAPATGELARATLDEIYESARVETPDQGEPDERALRRYIAGRSALVDGDARRAVGLLEQAVEADPEAAAAWRDLGEARRAAGDRFGADAAHRRALEINPNERRSLLRLGLEAATRRDFERAVELLARIDLFAHPGDPAEPALVRAALGQSLIETGRLAAGAELLAQGVDLPEFFGRPTLYANELGLLYRSRAESWTAAGDAYVRLDDPAMALGAYERAAELPTFDAVGLLSRRMYALLAAGRPSSAGAALVEAVTAEGLTLEDQHIALIGYLREAAPARARIGASIERELVEAAEGLSAEERRAVAGRLALARAAALEDDAAAVVLRERLAAAPGDLDAIRQLLARTGDGSAAALAEQTARLIDASPLNERAYTRTAVRLAGGAQELLDALPAELESQGGALLRARLLGRLGRVDEAEEVLTDVIGEDASFAPGVSALAELLLAQGRVEEAAVVVDRLDARAGEPALLAKAQGLAGTGRVTRAVELLTEAADEAGASAVVAYQLGSLLERLGDAEGAAARYGQAASVDPLLEEAHAARIRLFSQNGALADREKLFAAVRDLRGAIPSARTLRWLRAQELAASGQYGAAERALRDLAEEGDDPLVERALVAVWIGTSSGDTAEAWLREKLEDRPGDAGLMGLLARALAAQGKHEEAAEELRAVLDRRPEDAGVSLQLEGLLREQLGRPEKADELALARLENAPPSVAVGLQEAGVWLRRERYAEAAEAVERSVRRAGRVTPEELRGSLAVAQSIGNRSQEDAALRGLAVGILDALGELDTELPEGAHRLRAILVVLDGGTPEEARAAVARAYRDLGGEADETARAAAQAFVQQERQEDAAAFVESLVVSQAAVNETLVSLWIGLVAQFPNPESAERMIDFLLERRAAEATLQRVFTREIDLTEQEAAGELAHAMAQQYGGGVDDEAAEAMYRVALRHNPRHVMANNNLGYQMLVERRNLAEAERMIEIAYEGEPNSAAVVDSLGWARYLRGVIEDETDEMGLVVREGAIGLLERAVEIGVGESDPGVFEIRIHLGDAYWRAGREELALEQWRMGRVAAQALVQNIGVNAPPEITEAIAGATARLEAAEMGAAPPVAALADEAGEGAQALETAPGEAR